MKKKLFLKMWLPLILFVLMSIGTVLVMRYFGQPWSGICAFVTYGGFLLHAITALWRLTVWKWMWT